MTVSIISAVHNEELYIAEMIESVIAQSIPAWELIFVSDGSSDRTIEIINEYSQYDNRIRLVGTGRKIGKVEAFNEAFAHSTGSVIILLAGDDKLPSYALELRTSDLKKFQSTDKPAASYCKLQTISTDTSVDGTVLPRGTAPARSGGTVAFTKEAAELVFPIPSRLISEDLWLTYALECVTEHEISISEVGLLYRLHSENSNPRRRSFDEMFSSMTKRHKAWDELLNTDRFRIPDETRSSLVGLRDLEHLRQTKSTLSILTYRNAKLMDRLAYASMSNPAIYCIRNKFYSTLSGRRGR